MTEEEILSVRLIPVHLLLTDVCMHLLTGSGARVRGDPVARVAHPAVQRYDRDELERRSGVGGSGCEEEDVPVLIWPSVSRFNLLFR